MRARMMRSRIWSASRLVGLGLLTLSCGTSTPAIGVTSPTLTPSSSPTATISPTATATSVAIAGCSAPTAIILGGSTVNYHFENPPGPLPTTIPFPPGTLVATSGLGIQAGSVEYNLCTPATTPAAITAFMYSALPAAGWLRKSVRACNAPSYSWYKGKYGMDIFVDVNSSMPDVWVLDMCPHVGEN